MAISLRGLEPWVRAPAEYALAVARFNGLNPVVTSARRDWALQLKLRQNWEECVTRGLYPSAVSLSPGFSCKYPANQPGDSSHNYGLSFDSWVPDEQMPLWKAIRRWVGFSVPDHDPIHAEVPEWRSYVVSQRTGS